ncbi:mitochondrial ribosomal protein L20 isoform X2 [Rhipicephalus microplus]|uniref:mitochondrial ribosomal protein L20 isoform X2 n=1 Tax=Rhipicephalus microplus TaxID=6941 RepID=UPI003F6C5784
MVFLSAVNFGRKVKSGARQFWKRQRIFQISANFYGRRRNCYRLAIRSVQKALIHSQDGRRAKRDELQRIWNIRTESASLEHGISYEPFYINLAKGIATLARFMRSIEAVDETSTLQEPPEGVITRGLL